ncbi:MAG: DUF1553 domain-containing protein [Verrucomicrobiales bacterium]|nr:DUF1553 domain-containing protein [Verrucomicrobiales bacterium]
MKTPHRPRHLALFALALLVLHPLAAADFQKDIAPVLEAKCLGCHTANIAKGDVDLSSASAAADFLQPGSAQTSKLFKAVLPGTDGSAPDMPKKGTPLTPEETQALRQWIDSGATWPEGLVLKEAAKTGRDWWAYQPLQKPPHTSIDAFIEAALTERGLSLNPPADARTLIRRITYDLTGLPPSAEEVTAFEQAFAADADSAVSALADRLLASPRYGEHWGRHWLDVVRFGESNGYERNVIINSLWPFRDYVITSLNADKPCDQLIREHLAGDILAAGDPQREIGSAFLVAGPYDDVGNQDAAQAAQIRANTLDEIITATGEAFLGMTLGCARCHDHKFDPITQEDYYALYATFSGVRHGQVPWATPQEKAAHAAQLKPLEAQKTQLENDLKTLDAAILQRARAKLPRYQKSWTRPPPDRTGTEEVFPPVTAKFVRLVCEAQDINPTSATGFGIDEFEIWNTEATPRNVALTTHGAKASGLAREIEDFPNAYGPQHAIDGKTGARFLARSTDLTIELARPERIHRVVFSSAKNEATPEQPKFAFVADYRIEVSTDGTHWTTVATSADRQPVVPFRSRNRGQSGAHLDQRLRQLEITAEEKQEKARLSRELAATTKAISAVPALPIAWLGTRNPKDAAGPFHIFTGGSPQRPGATVTPTSLSALSEVTPTFALPASTAEGDRRKSLAQWITDPANPLTWRVLANRVWHYHFGTGIVDTPNDFGFMGGRPTHPQLLDFLARQLQENGFHLKPLHRLIVTSRAYRQTSTWHETAAKIDGDARLLWRFPPRRLSAEELRDTLLTVSGKLDLQMGGPGFRLYHFMQDNVCTYEPLPIHGPETYRRAVYHQNARAAVVDLMTEFDQPDCAFSAPRRAQTTTPLQALTLLNHSFTLDMAEAFATRLQATSKLPPQQATHAFQIAYQRPPTATEQSRAVQLIQQHGLRALTRALLNSSELMYCD